MYVGTISKFISVRVQISDTFLALMLIQFLESQIIL